MGLKPGMTNNSSGRPSGSLNKQTATLRAFVAQLIEENRDKIKDDLNKLDGERRLMYFEKLLQYVLPKPTPTEFPLEEGLSRLHYGNKTFTVTNKEMEGQCVDERVPTIKEYLNAKYNDGDI